MPRRIWLVLLIFLSVAVFGFSEEEKDTRPLMAIPDFALQPEGQIEDEEMGMLAAAMVIPYMEQRYRILKREDLLKFLESKNFTQTDLFRKAQAVGALKEIGVDLLFNGRICKTDGGKYRIEMLVLNLNTSNIDAQAKPGEISKTGDLSNECRRMAQEIVAQKPDKTPTPSVITTPPPLKVDNETLKKTEVEITTRLGSFSIRLFPDEAPVTVQNFLRLARSGYYEGKFVHRVIKDFVVQMGASDRVGSGQSLNIPDELNDHPHVRGTVAMARNLRTKGYSHGFQFYIALKRLEKLDRNYTVFGHIVKGMDVIDKIAALETGMYPSNPFYPKDDLFMDKATITETEEPFNPPAMLPKMITTSTEFYDAEVQTTCGTFYMRFYPEKAPKLVANFLDLAQRHFYNGLEWHRVIRDFVIQTGDPDPNDPNFDEAPREVIREPASDLKNLKGTVAAAKSQEDTDINSTSQFYINLKDNDFLDTKYAVFAFVYKGIEVVEMLGNTPTNADERPIDPIYVDRINIRNLGNEAPWETEAVARNLVPAPVNTPHSKLYALIATDMGDIVMKLYAEQSPRTVANFVALAQKGFYDGMFVHRVARDKIIQFGDPKTNRQEDQPAIPDEKNSLRSYKGTVAMANTGVPNSATCQFFINIVDSPEFDGKYVIFGEIVEGIEIAAKISNLKTTDANGKPEKRIFFSIKLMKLSE